MNMDRDTESGRTILEGRGYSEQEISRIWDKLKAIVHTLVVSDELMHNVILHAEGKPYTLSDDAAAKVQYGLVLYWTAHPPAKLQEMLDAIFDKFPGLRDVWDALTWILEHLEPPKVTEKEYEFLLKEIKDNGGVVAPEGEILGTKIYQQIDLHWLYAFFNYLLNLLPRAFPLAPFGTTPFSGPLQPGKDGKVRIAIIGDWGTGDYAEGASYDPAQAVINDINAMKPKPDYIIHLGDVYYSGTDERLPSGEEYGNLLKMWPQMPPERSFTLNSNHEMYGGAQGYFNIALGLQPKKNTPFSHQNGTSYFSLTFKDWVVVGLDAAYHDPSALYMEGSLGDKAAYPDQYRFLNKAAAGAGNVIVLTHQTGMDAKGVTPLTLLNEICSEVGKDSFYWYWGHLHLGIVYSEQSVAGKKGVAARCIGHSAVPFGAPYTLKDYLGKTVKWYADTSANLPGDPKVNKNGYAVLTLSDDGLEEAIYETGNPIPVWKN